MSKQKEKTNNQTIEKPKFTTAELDKKISSMKINIDKNISFSQYRVQETISDVEKNARWIKTPLLRKHPYFWLFCLYY